MPHGSPAPTTTRTSSAFDTCLPDSAEVQQAACAVEGTRSRSVHCEHVCDTSTLASRSAPQGLKINGEVVIWQAGRFDFAALQDRLRAGPRRAHSLAAVIPAAYVVFDLLAVGRTDLRGRPYTERRAALETLLGRGLPAGLVLTPSTIDPGVARSWVADHGSSGIEGVVAKRLDQSYRPGIRGWQKLRPRLTAEAIVGGVIGPPDAPRVLVLGRHDPDGGLHLVGRTTELTLAGRAAVAAVLRPHGGAGHPWPNPLPSTRWGRPGRPG